MKRLMTAVIAAAVLLPSAAAEAGTKYWFTCGGASKAQNQEVVTWGPTAPTASFQSGAGCGELDPGLLSTQFGVGDVVANVDFYGEGTHTGAIDTINVELHSLLLSQARAATDMGGEADLIVDGEPLAEAVLFRVLPVKSSTGLTEAFRFSFARTPDIVLNDQGEEVEVPVPLVDADGPHTIQIRFSSHFLDYNNVWVWGASEVPAGVEINPAAPAGTQVFV